MLISGYIKYTNNDNVTMGCHVIVTFMIVVKSEGSHSADLYLNDIEYCILQSLAWHEIGYCQAKLWTLIVDSMFISGHK